MNIIVIVLHVLIIAVVLWRLSLREDKRLKVYYFAAALLKIACGIALGVIYYYYYQAGDTIVYFEDARLITTLAKENIGAYAEFLWYGKLPDDNVQLSMAEGRAVLFIKFVSVVSLLTGDNYWLTTAYFSLVSFLTAWFLVKKIMHYLPLLAPAALFAFAFFPSVVFWSAGLIKESLAMAALFYLSALFVEFWFSGKLKVVNIISAGAACWILWGLKYYFLGIFIPVVFTSIFYRIFLNNLLRSKKVVVQVAVWLGMFLLPLLVVTFLHPNFYIERVLEVIVYNHDAYEVLSALEDKISFDNLKPNIASFVSNAPLALFSGLFRPLIIEAGNVFQYAASIENLALLILTLIALKNFRKVWQREHAIVLFSILIYVSLLCILITLSTPNYGTLSRYRVGYLPYFVFLVSINNPLIFHITLWNRLARKYEAG